jgi:hypothetical protein
MLSVQEIEEYYKELPAELLDIVLELRSVIYTLCPEVTEIIQWKGLTYYDSSRGGPVSAGLCQIFAASAVSNLFLRFPKDSFEKIFILGKPYLNEGHSTSGVKAKNKPEGMRPHVQLAFIHGSFLPDPHGLLEGNTKCKRFVRIYSYEEAPWEALKELIQVSSRFDPRTQTFN